MYLFGAGGHAKVIRDILEAQGENISGIIDDNRYQSRFMNLPVVHELDGKGVKMIVCIGDNRRRKQIVERFSKNEILWGRAIHPQAIVSPFARVGQGSVVMPGGIINSCSEIGEHCIVNTGASVDHDCQIGDYVHISPHATLCGGVCVGEGSWIGAGAVVVPGVKIGRWCVVGAGAVVLNDVKDGAVVYGVPARLK